MLDAIFQFTDFEAFQGAELDTEVVLSHRKASRQIQQKNKNATALKTGGNGQVKESRGDNSSNVKA